MGIMMPTAMISVLLLMLMMLRLLWAAVVALLVAIPIDRIKLLLLLR